MQYKEDYSNFVQLLIDSITVNIPKKVSKTMSVIKFWLKNSNTEKGKYFSKIEELNETKDYNTLKLTFKSSISMGNLKKYGITCTFDPTNIIYIYQTSNFYICNANNMEEKIVIPNLSIKLSFADINLATEVISKFNDKNPLKLIYLKTFNLNPFKVFSANTLIELMSELIVNNNEQLSEQSEQINYLENQIDDLDYDFWYDYNSQPPEIENKAFERWYWSNK